MKTMEMKVLKGNTHCRPIVVIQSLTHVQTLLQPHGDCQAPVFMGFLRQDHLSGLTFPPSRDLPKPGIEPESPVLAGRFLSLSHQGSPVSFKIKLKKILMNQAARTPGVLHFPRAIWDDNRVA